MTQNTSHAVMQQRHEAHDSLDDFPTPPWATRALVEHIIKPKLARKKQRMLPSWSVWEPACNRGYMTRPLAEYFREVMASDVHNYGDNYIHDFLNRFDQPGPTPDWIITNPPFRLAAQFAERCLELKPAWGFAMLVRTAFLEGMARYEELFSQSPPRIVAQFVERVPMVKGRHDPEASTATAYAWLVWSDELVFAGEPPTVSTEFMWIPPCRRQLQRADDV